MNQGSLTGWVDRGRRSKVALPGMAYQHDMEQAFSRVQGKSKMCSTPQGIVEYTEHGIGFPVLVIHGSGGGFDQGELIAENLLGEGFYTICPSRFGYLRSTFHEGATFDDQADAYVSLLDELDINKVAVVALSHGGPSALLLAVLHPERVSSLTLVSAGVVSVRSQHQNLASRMGNTWATIFKYNWLYWGISWLFKKKLMGLMGADQAVIDSLIPEQRRLVERVIEEMNPVSIRSSGVIFDNRSALPGDRIAGIRTPTLVIHATDDSLQVFHHAEFAVATIPGARLLKCERGGHLLFAVEKEQVRTTVQKHITENHLL